MDVVSFLAVQTDTILSDRAGQPENDKEAFGVLGFPRHEKIYIFLLVLV